MDFDELLITTGVDALIKLVKERKEIELTEVAELLKIPSPTVREWAQMLEDEGLISVRYKLAKSYLTWIEPSKEEIKREKLSFLEKKTTLSNELSSLRGRLDSEKQSLTDLKTAFKEFYDGLYPKLKELDERTKSLNVAETKSKTMVPVYDDKLKEISAKLDDLDSMLVFTQSQLNKTKKDVLEHGVTIDEVSSLKAIKDEIAEMNKQFSELEGKAHETVKSLPKETMKYGDFNKELSEIRNHFADVVSESKKAKEFFKKSEQNLKEFKTLKKKMDTKGVSFPSLKLELSKMSKTLELMEKRFSELSEKINKSRDVVDTISSSEVDMAKLSQTGKFAERLGKLEEEEKKLEEQIRSLEKASKGLSKVGEVVKSFEKIRKEIDNKRNKLSETASEVFKRMDEEGETYQVFQKIKEKAVGSIEEYSSQLSAIKSDLNSVSKETKAISSELKTGIRDAIKSASGSDVETLLNGLEQVKKKKELFDDIHGSIGELEEKLDNVSKRVSLLSKQADLIKLRTGKEGVSAEETEKEEEGLKNEVELTKAEEQEFQKKREELMHMIKKLWEEG